MSGWLFAMVSHTGFEAMKIALSDTKNIVRCCADDTAAALDNIAHLTRLYGPFKLLQNGLGHTLKDVKCVLVPLARFSNELAAEISAWLTAQLSEWRNFKVAAMAKYLGFFPGSHLQS